MRKFTLRRLLTILALIGTPTLALGPPSQATPSTTTADSVIGRSPTTTSPQDGSAVSLARAFVRRHAASYGLSATDVDELGVSSVVPTAHNGLTNVYFQQRLNSIDVSNAMLNVTVTAEGDVLSVASNAVAGAQKKANSKAPEVTDVQAATSAAAALGLIPTEQFVGTDAPEGPDRERTLSDGGISTSPIPVRLVYQEDADGGLRLAWELVIHQLDGQHSWQIRMDAETRDELGRADWVSADSHRVFPLPTEAPSFGNRELLSNPATSASPFGWNDTNGVAGADSTLTIGNNVNAYTDVDSNNVPDGGSSRTAALDSPSTSLSTLRNHPRPIDPQPCPTSTTSTTAFTTLPTDMASTRQRETSRSTTTGRGAWAPTR